MNRRGRAARARGKRRAAGDKHPFTGKVNGGRRRESGRARHTKPRGGEAALVSSSNAGVPPLQ